MPNGQALLEQPSKLGEGIDNRVRLVRMLGGTGKYLFKPLMVPACPVEQHRCDTRAFRCDDIGRTVAEGTNKPDPQAL